METLTIINPLLRKGGDCGMKGRWAVIVAIHQVFADGSTLGTNKLDNSSGAWPIPTKVLGAIMELIYGASSLDKVTVQIDVFSLINNPEERKTLF